MAREEGKQGSEGADHGDPLIGQLVADYRVVRRLGRGGMGTVYEVVHPILEQRAALKVLNRQHGDDPEYLARFEAEARTASRAQFPGKVLIYNYGRLPGGAPYILMELLTGQTLRQRLERLAAAGARLPEEEVLAVARQAAAALRVVHRQGIVHRDLKPENLMLCPDSGGEILRILDFGIARQLGGPRLTTDGRYLGTARYSSPEQCDAAADVGPPSDVYSLGVILYELLCGEAPFVGGSGGVIAAHLRDAPPPLAERAPAAPPWLRDLVHRMLLKPPAERPTIAEVAAALGLPALPEVSEPRREPPTTPPAGPGAEEGAQYSSTGKGQVRPRPGPASAPGRRWRAALPALLLSGLVAGGALSLWPEREGPTRLISLPGGRLMMGSLYPDIDSAANWCQRLDPDGCDRSLFEREQPSREVQVSPFRIEATEVTNQQFGAWLGRLPGLRIEVSGDDVWVLDGGVKLVNLYPSYSPPFGMDHQDGRVVVLRGYERRPVRQVTWHGAARYCAALGRRLPTEAEWELAARGARGRRFPWGQDEPRCDGVVFARLPKLACAQPNPEVAPVGSSRQDRTPEGVLDLGGNVAEWVADRFTDRYQPCPAGACQDPVVDGPLDGSTLRVFRGGSYASVAAFLRGAGRGRWQQDRALRDVGFRCVAAAR